LRQQLDSLDRQLLALMQQNNLQTADQLAERIGLSASAIARRLRRLRATGAIAADVSLVSPQAAGDPLTAVVHVQLDRHTPKDDDRLRRRLIASPNVQRDSQAAANGFRLRQWRACPARN